MKSVDTASDARTRILETAWRLIGEQQDASVSVVEIARQAGVSRQTLYVNFGSRAGLLTAMVAHRDETSAALAQVKRLRSTLPPAQALEPYLRAWFDYLPDIFPVARALSAAAPTDADARAAWDSRMQQLHGGILALMKALKAQGRLRSEWRPEAAADWCFSLMHVDTWQHLVVERGWRPAEVVDRVVASLRAELLTRGAGRG